MKNRKVFMGIGAALLTVAGIAATKANTKYTTYYYQSTPVQCSVVLSPPTCSGTGPSCTVSINSKTYTVFSGINGNRTTCVTALTKS